MGLKLIFANPLAVFLATWLAVFWLYSLQLSFVLQPLTATFVLTVACLAVAAALAFAGGYVLRPAAAVRRPGPPGPALRRLVKTLRALLLAEICILAISVVYFRGIPLQWMLSGSNLSYTDFGFPTLHGLFNSMVLLTGTATFWLLLKHRPFRGRNVILAFCFVVPIVTLHRQSLVSLLLQCLFIYAATRRGSFLQAAKGVGAILLVCIALFSILGNVRTGNDSLAELADLRGGGAEMPLWLLWPYMYLTTPLSNFFELTTLDFGLSLGSTSLAGLTPTVVRELLWGEPVAITADFAARSFNASGYAFPLFVDFHWFGVFAFTAAVMWAGGMLLRRFIAQRNLYNLLNLCLLNHVVFLFVFSNLLLTWGVVFQFVIVRLLRRTLSAIPAVPDPSPVGAAQPARQALDSPALPEMNRVVPGRAAHNP